MIIQAKREHSTEIARLIMQAMTVDCCLHFCGRNHSAEDFFKVMKKLVEREDSQYSYLNTICSTDDTTGEISGIIVSYDGGKLHQLRQPFIDAARKEWNRDLSGIPDETEPGELYLDSLAVRHEYRRKGIATSLLMAAADKGRSMNLPLGLLVDAGNPDAERLYKKVGFRQVGTNSWGGHPMKHLRLEL